MQFVCHKHAVVCLLDAATQYLQQYAALVSVLKLLFLVTQLLIISVLSLLAVIPFYVIWQGHLFQRHHPQLFLAATGALP